MLQDIRDTRHHQMAAHVVSHQQDIPGSSLPVFAKMDLAQSNPSYRACQNRIAERPSGHPSRVGNSRYQESLYLSKIRLSRRSLCAEFCVPQEGWRVNHIGALLDLGGKIKKLRKAFMGVMNEVLKDQST